jgi:hypothetical protein
MTNQTLQRASFYFTCLAIVLYMTMSSALLWEMGIPYDAQGGSYVFKFHPGSYMLLIALLLALCSRGNPLAAAGRILMRNPALASYLYATMFLLIYSALRYGPSGSAYIIETLQMPAVLVIVLLHIDDAQLRVLYRWIVALLAVNTVIAIGESIAERRLVPYVVAGGDVIYEDIFRPTALLGHPLANALITGSVMFTLFDAGRGRWRYVVVSLLTIGLLAFGGRTGFLVAAIVLMFYLATRVLAGIKAGRWSYLQLLGSVISLSICAGLLTAFITLTGIGDRIFAHLYFDNSATYRLRDFEALQYMSTEDLLFGIPPADIARVAEAIFHGREATIENFWLIMLMQFGAFGLLAFACALLGLALSMFRRAGTGGRLAIVVFLLVASSNNSIAAKTCSMTILFASLESVRAFRSTRSRSVPPGVDTVSRDPVGTGQLDGA